MTTYDSFRNGMLACSCCGTIHLRLPQH